jgi:hypothetical protein
MQQKPYPFHYFIKYSNFKDRGSESPYQIALKSYAS